MLAPLLEGVPLVRVSQGVHREVSAENARGTWLSAHQRPRRCKQALPPVHRPWPDRHSVPEQLTTRSEELRMPEMAPDAAASAIAARFEYFANLQKLRGQVHGIQ